uniref:FAD synthase n=1 Tax=Ciona savignyi TaxID=51511 RepID=H2YMQ1_CIOSA
MFGFNHLPRLGKNIKLTSFTSILERNIRLYSGTSTTKMPKTAAILIIGDEILKGQTQDTNSSFLSKSLHDLGVVVKKISVVGDDIQEIAAEVKNFSKLYDLVLTSGGVGPTHDDVTLPAIAHACGEELFPHPTLVQLCEKHFGVKALDSPEMKLAHVPRSAILHFGVDTLKAEKLKFPLIAVENVYIFPGIPVLLQRLFTNLIHLFKSEDTFHTRTLLVNCFETEIAETLQACVEKFEGTGVSVGSYPDWSNNYYKVKLMLESTNPDAVSAAVTFLQQNLPQDRVVDVDPVALHGDDVLGGNMMANHPLLWQKIQLSVGILEEAFAKYASFELCIGFNGGKDCTALLHLCYAVLCRRSNNSANHKLQALYIKDDMPFEEMEQFMNDSVKRYNLNLITLQGNMKAALNSLRSSQPNIKAVVMGTRCSDPYSKNLSPFTMTDKSWPQFMRVNPMLHWSYHDIWEFLRALHLPYCVLYDKGYTSIGSRDRTEKNKKLAIKSPQGSVYYRPAYTLQDEDLERNGRL